MVRLLTWPVCGFSNLRDIMKKAYPSRQILREESLAAYNSSISLSSGLGGCAVKLAGVWAAVEGDMIYQCVE